VEQKRYLESINNKLSKVNSIQQAIEADVPALVTLKNQTSKEFVLDAIQLMIYDLNLMFGNNMQMSNKQVEILAIRILENYYYLKISDLKLFFKKMETKKIFGQLSPNAILQEIEAYTNERAQIAAEISQHESNQFKNVLISDSIPDEIVEKLKEFNFSSKISNKENRKLHREAQKKYLHNKSFGIKKNLDSQ